jgi:hypothetical protein
LGDGDDKAMNEKQNAVSWFFDAPILMTLFGGIAVET